MPSTKTPTHTITPVLHDKVFADRLTIFRKQYVDKSQIPAAKKLGVSQSALWYMEHGQGPIRFELISKLVKDFGLNQDWFNTGKGKPQAAGAVKANLITDLGALATEMELLKKYLQIMEANQNHFIKIIEGLEKKVEGLEKKLGEK